MIRGNPNSHFDQPITNLWYDQLDNWKSYLIQHRQTSVLPPDWDCVAVYLPPVTWRSSERWGVPIWHTTTARFTLTITRKKHKDAIHTLPHFVWLRSAQKMIFSLFYTKVTSTICRMILRKNIELKPILHIIKSLNYFYNLSPPPPQSALPHIRFNAKMQTTLPETFIYIFHALVGYK